MGLGKDCSLAKVEGPNIPGRNDSSPSVDKGPRFWSDFQPVFRWLAWIFTDFRSDVRGFSQETPLNAWNRGKPKAEIYSAPSKSGGTMLPVLRTHC